MTDREALGEILDSAWWKGYRLAARIDSRKVELEYQGIRRPLPSSRYAQGLVAICRNHPPKNQPVPPPTSPPGPAGTYELSGVVRDISHFSYGTPGGRAFVQAGGTRLCLQFRDPKNDAVNRARLTAWAAEWRRHGVRVDGWWRVNHSPQNTPPTVTGVDGWWPNAEQPDEIARLPLIYQAGPYAGVMTLGKAPGAWPPSGGVLAAECFRESAAGDHTIGNSVRFWRLAGLPDSRLVVMLQGYGVPFAPPVEQARQAVALGVRRLMLYPADGFAAQEITGIGKAAAS